MISGLPDVWRARADELKRFAPPAAEAFRQAADELEAAIAKAGEEPLTLREASAESGYARRTLREKLAKGEIWNAGRRHAPRIRRVDLPRKPRSNGGGWDASNHVAEIVGRPR